MARKDRRSSSFSTGARPASTRPLGHRPAPSYGLSDLAYRFDVGDIEASDPPGVTPHRSSRLRTPPGPPTRRKARPASVSAFFSPFPTLPPTRLVREPLKAAMACARRGVRREVLFASGGHRKGSAARKRYFSNRSCR